MVGLNDFKYRLDMQTNYHSKYKDRFRCKTKIYFFVIWLTHLSAEINVTVEAAQEGRRRVDLLPVGVEESVHHEDSAAVGTGFRSWGIGFSIVEKIQKLECLILMFLFPHCLNCVANLDHKMNGYNENRWLMKTTYWLFIRIHKLRWEICSHDFINFLACEVKSYLCMTISSVCNWHLDNQINLKYRC